MNKILIAGFVYISSSFFGMATHEHYLEKFWSEVCEKRDVENRDGFLPDDLNGLVEVASIEMRPGDKKILMFYPEYCGFQKLLLDDGPLVEMDAFQERAKALGFKVNFCLPRRFIAKFDSILELEKFLKERFGVDTIPLQDCHLQVPAKMMIAEIEKLEPALPFEDEKTNY